MNALEFEGKAGSENCPDAGAEPRRVAGLEICGRVLVLATTISLQVDSRASGDGPGIAAEQGQ